MKKIILSITTIAIVLCAATVIVSSEVVKRSAVVPATAYGSYIDGLSKKDTIKTVSFNSENINATYVRTENLKDNPVGKRSDSYGTYDVYIDDQDTEYLYLFNTDLLCGFKKDNIGMATPQKEAVKESEAQNIALEFLCVYSENAMNFILESCVYDELSGIYDIQYYVPISGYKSDDIFRVWINAKGEVASFSEFNRGRYSKINLNESAYQRAESKIARQLKSATQEISFTIVDSYITITDKGKLALVQVVDYKIPMGKDFLPQRDTVTQLI